MGKKKNARKKIDESPAKKTETKKYEVASTSKALLIDRVRKHIDKIFNFRYNTIANIIEYKTKGLKDFIEFDDWEFNSLMIQLDYKGMHLPDYKVRQMIASVYVGEKFDPVRDYILSLANWDGKTDYIKNFMDQLLLVKETDREYMLNGFKKWFVALVMSFIEKKAEPYNINQVALIIMSKKQGLYKSTWLGSIIPERLRLQYYYPNSFNPHNKDHLKYLATRMLINLDEMESYNKTDIGEMKSIISTSQVSLRLPYGRTDINIKRRASFCGSINDRQFLRDETGSRRWFIIEVDAIDFNIDFDVDPMYAQARELHRQHFKYWFDGIDIAEMNKRNSEYTKVTMEEEMLLQMFDKPDSDERNDPDVQIVTTTQITNICAKENERMNVNNSVITGFGKALTKHDFERVSFRQRNSKNPMWGWRVKTLLIGDIKKDNNYENDDNSLF